MYMFKYVCLYNIDLYKTHARFPATQKEVENDQPDVSTDKQSKGKVKHFAGCNKEKKRKHSYYFFFPRCKTIN